MLGNPIENFPSSHQQDSNFGPSNGKPASSFFQHTAHPQSKNNMENYLSQTSVAPKCYAVCGACGFVNFDCGNECRWCKRFVSPKEYNLESYQIDLKGARSGYYIFHSAVGKIDAINIASKQQNPLKISSESQRKPSPVADLSLRSKLLSKISNQSKQATVPPLKMHNWFTPNFAPLPVCKVCGSATIDSKKCLWCENLVCSKIPQEKLKRIENTTALTSSANSSESKRKDLPKLDKSAGVCGMCGPFNKCHFCKIKPSVLNCENDKIVVLQTIVSKTGTKQNGIKRAEERTFDGQSTAKKPRSTTDCDKLKYATSTPNRRFQISIEVGFNPAFLKAKEPSLREICQPEDVFLGHKFTELEMYRNKGLAAAEIKCRFAKIGSYKVQPLDNVLFCPEGVRLSIPHPRSQMKVVLEIPRSSIVGVLAHLGKAAPAFFMYIKKTACKRIRVLLDMKDPSKEPYYDFESSKETQKRITLLPEKISNEDKLIIKRIFSKEFGKDVLTTIEAKEANVVLVKT